MPESNLQKIAKAEIRAAVETLIHAATNNKVAVVGFVFGPDPAIFIRFGNTTESGPALAELYLKLADTAEELSDRTVIERIDL